MNKTLCLVALAMLVTATGLFAHHAFAAEYDEHRVVTVTGTVTAFKWINPHVWLNIDGRDASGRITKWRFEMGSPAGLTARGWNKKELKAGEQITLEGFGAKNGQAVANATWVALPDGRKLYGGFQETPGAPPKPGALQK